MLVEWAVEMAVETIHGGRRSRRSASSLTNPRNMPFCCKSNDGFARSQRRLPVSPNDNNGSIAPAQDLEKDDRFLLG